MVQETNDAIEFFAELGFETKTLNHAQFMAWNDDEVFWVGIDPAHNSTIHTRTRALDDPTSHQVFDAWDETLNCDFMSLLGALSVIGQDPEAVAQKVAA